MAGDFERLQPERDKFRRPSDPPIPADIWKL